MPEDPSAVAARVARRSIRVLIGMREGLNAGDDSGLISVWEEVCVQVQGQESALWDAYDRTVYDVVHGEVEALPLPILRALWTWIENEGELDSPGYDIDDVTEYLVKNVYEIAADWSNRRIRAYLARQ